MTCSIFNLEGMILSTYESITRDKTKMAENLKLMIIEGAYTVPLSTILVVVNGVIKRIKSEKGFNIFRVRELENVYRNLLDFYPKSSYRVIPELSINTDQTQTLLIEIRTLTGTKALVSKSLSAYISTQLFRTLTGVGIIDLTSEKPFWISGSNLRDSIELWRDRMVGDLVAYLDRKGFDFRIEYETGRVDSVALYLAKVKPVMTKAWECIMSDLESSNNPHVLNGKFDTSIDSIGKREVITPIVALTVLNNFDEVISFFSNGEINIHPAFKGSFELYLGKYTFSKKVLSKSSYEGDEFSDVSAERIMPNLLKRVFEIIPDGHGNNGYCTTHDLNAIGKHIFTIMSTVELMIASNSSLFTAVDSAEPYRTLIADDSSENDRYVALLLILDSTEFKNRFADPLKLTSIIAHLAKLQAAFERSVPTDSIEEEAAFHTLRNVINQFVSFIRNTCNLAYGQITDRGFDINTNSGIRKNKIAALAKIKEALRLNLKDKHAIGLYHPFHTLRSMTGPVWTSDSLKNEEYLDYISLITGTNLRIPILLEYIENNPELSLYTINDFIYRFNLIVYNAYNARAELLSDDKSWESFVDGIISTLIGTTEYVAFTDMIAYESGLDLSMIYDLNLNPQPTQGMSPTISKWTLNKRDFVDLLNAILREAPDHKLGTPMNIFLRFPNLRSEVPGKKFGRAIFTDPHIFRSDVYFKLKGHDQIVKSTKLSDSELFVTSLVYEFLDSTLKTGLVVNLIENVSDKARVPLGVTNGHAEIKPGKTFNLLSEDELFDLYYELTAWYYRVIEAKLIADYNKLFTAANWLIPQDGQLESYIKELQKHKLEDVRKATRKIFSEGGYFELLDFIHYDPKPAKDGTLRFNNSLYIYIKASLSEAGKQFFKQLVDSGIQETITLAKLDKTPLTLVITKEQAKLLLDFLLVEKQGVTVADVELYLTNRDNLVYNDSTPALKLISDALFTRYVYTHNLLAEADLLMSGKFLFLHKSKQAAKTIEELTSMSTDDLLNFFIKDLSDRGKVSRKRMATLTSLSEGVTPNNMFGPGRKTRQAYIEPHKTTLYNPNGDPKHVQATNDGCILGNGVYDVIETMGYVGKNYHTNSLKIISIIPTFFNMHFIKCAKYSINNERIRGSFDSPLDNHHYNLHLLFKKMNMELLPAGFLERWAKDDMLLSNKLIWKRVLDGRLAYFDEESLEVEGSTITANWRNELGEVIYKESAEIQTVYDLWEYFGGCDSYSFNESQRLVLSESSLIMTALLVCKYGGDLKERLISKAIDTESAKVGIVNINTVNEVADPNTPLLYLIVDSSRTGVQNEYTHSMLDLDIPLLGQAILALALNGANPELALFVFDEIAAIVEDSLVSIDKYFDPNTRELFKIKLVSDLKESLLSSNISSTANDIVRYTMAKMEKWVKEGKLGVAPLLPFSDRNIFSKITSDLLVKLNTHGIRQRSNGMAVIQNPSHGIIGVYEDKYGRIATREDVKKLSPNFDYTQGLESLELFLDVLITEDVSYTVGEVVREVTRNEAGEIIDNQVYILTDPFKLWYVENLINSNPLKSFYKVHNAKRDLKTRLVTFKEILSIDPETNSASYILRNLWGIRSTKFRLLVSELSAAETKEKKTQVLQTFRLLDAEAVNEFLKYKITSAASLAFMRANYIGLADVRPYYYKTFADFQASLEPNSDPDAGKTFVYNVVTRAGELIIPNRYKNEFGIEDDSLYTVLHSVDESGRPNYFDAILEKRLKKTHDVIIDKKHFGVTLTTNDTEILITDLQIEGGMNVVLGEDDDTYYITDVTGEKLFNALNGKYQLAKLRLSNGKIFYLIQVENDKLAEYLINLIKGVNLYYNERNFQQVLRNNRKAGISFDPSSEKDINEYIVEQSMAVYNSFRLTLNTISTRIPSLSWPSFQATVTVAFTDNELNDGYMNIWEMWFLGSDFDIDKAYTMMYTLDRLGRIAGNGLLDYSTPENIINSLENSISVQAKNIEFAPAWAASDVDNLPKALRKKDPIEIWQPHTEIGYITVNASSLTSDLIELLALYLPGIREEIEMNPLSVQLRLTPVTVDLILEMFADLNIKHDIYRQIIDKVRFKKGVIAVNTTANKPLSYRGQFYYYQWMRELNAFNKRNLVPFRQNRVMSKMWKATNSLLNYEAATKPMDSGLVTDPMDEVGSDTTTYNEFSPFTKLRMLYNALMGKDDVGGAANGIKADGGLQHFVTYQSMLEGVSSILTPNLSLKFDDNKGLTLVNVDIHKIANVRLSPSDFLETLKRRYPEDGKVLENPLILSLTAVYAAHPEFFKDETTKLPYYQRVEEAFALWGKVKDAASMTDALAREFLEYAANFEDNAADILSVLISLATDNAKELRLAYLNAPLELISIPIALTVYGVDVYSMVLICMKVLTPVLKAMTLNRFSRNYVKRDVSQAIDSCVKAKTLSATNADSLRKVVRLGNELRFLSLFYKINLGANTDIIELQRWMSLLSHVKQTFEDEYASEYRGLTTIYSSLMNNWHTIDAIPSGYKALVQSLISKCTLIPLDLLTDYHLNVFKKAVEAGLTSTHSKPLDFNKLFGTSDEALEYIENILNYFNIFSTGFNLISAIMKSPSYKSQLKAVVRTTQMFNSMICTNALSLELINLNPNSSVSDNTIKTLFSHLAIGEFVKGLTQFTFNKQDVESKFPNVFIPGSLQSSFNLASNTGVSLFMNTVRNGVIPRLQKEHNENFFVSSLIEKHNYQNKMSYYALPFNAFAAEDLLIERSYIAEAKSQFASIMKLASGLVNNKGEELTIGEVLYIYNLIASGGGMSATSTCVETISEFSTLPNQLKDIIENLDRQSELLNGNISSADPQTSPILNRHLIYRLDKIKKALESASRSYTDLEASVSLNSLWILTNAILVPSISQDEAVKLLTGEFTSEVLTNFELNTSDGSYVATLTYSINGLKITDKVPGVITVILDSKQENKYIIPSSSLEDIKYALRGRILYAENVLGIQNDITSVTTTKGLLSEIHTGANLDLSIKEILSGLDEAEITIIKLRSSILPYSVNFNNLLYLIVPDDVSYDITSPEMLNAVIGLTTNGGSTKSNVAKILSTLLKNPDIKSNNLTYWLKTLSKNKELLKTSKTIQNYIDWAVLEMSTVEFKEKMRRKLIEYTKVFNNESLRSFYFSSEVQNTELRDGDIFQVFGVDYLYLGEYQGKHVMCSLDGKANLSISYNAPDSIYLKIYSKKKSVYESLGIIRESLNTYNEAKDSIAKPFESLMLGDLVFVLNGNSELKWIVVDVIFDEKNELKLLLRLEDGNDDNITVIELSKDDINGSGYSTKTALVNYVNMSNKEHVFFNPIDNIQFEVPLNFTFMPNLFIKTKEGISGKFVKQQDDQIIILTESDKQLVPISSIVSISSTAPIIDAHLTYLVAPVEFYATEEDAARIRKEFNGNFTSVKSDKIKFIKSNIIRSNVSKWTASDVIRLNQYYDISTEIKNGAIIKLANGYFKVVSMNSGNIFGIMHHNDGSQYYTIKRVIDTADCEIYIPKTSKGIYVRPKADNTLSDFLVGTRVLEVLRSRFNADIDIVSDESNPHFAQIVNGRIIINTAMLDTYNKTLPANALLTLEKYIALLGLHEFTHLMLALLQANNFNLYLQIITTANAAIEIAPKNSDLRLIWNLIQASKEYDSDGNTINYKQLEELVVRAVEVKFRNNLDTILGSLDSNLELSLDNSLRAGFGLFLNLALKANLSKNMRSTILDFLKDVFGYTTTGSTIDFLRRNTVSADILSNIYCI